jgi:hypothetical protein
METAIWSLAPIVDCLIEADCNNKVKAGMYECEGCIGKGKRVLLTEMHTAEVIIDASEKIHVVSVY